MSNQGYYEDSHQSQNNNPFNDSGNQEQGDLIDASDDPAPPGPPPPPPQQQSEPASFQAPPGPPPGQAPGRAQTFKEGDFVPENERGEQREAMEQFEMSNTGNESEHDKDVAQLSSEFPGLDGSLIAAIYSDNGLGGAREILQELSQGGQ